jgi:hypothetical protein
MRNLLAAGFFLLPVIAAAQSPANGERIYFSTCVNCHGFPPLNGPETVAWKPDQIRNAIVNRVARMRYLNYLTDAELADVAAFIGRTLGVEPPPALDPTDLWWDTREPGWGLSLVMHRGPLNTVFGVVYTYTADRKPLWLAMPSGRWELPGRLSGNLYRASGPSFAGAFDPARVSVRPVGTIALDFAGSETATLSYSVDGVAVEKRLTRQPF